MDCVKLDFIFIFFIFILLVSALGISLYRFHKNENKLNEHDEQFKVLRDELKKIRAALREQKNSHNRE